MSYSGESKIKFCRQLGRDWQDLAIYLEIPAYRCNQFPQGRECYAILEWLEEDDKRFQKLPKALKALERDDLLAVLQLSPSISDDEVMSENKPESPPPRILDVHSLSDEQLRALQSDTAQYLGLPIFFKDKLKIGGYGPKMAVIPAGQFLMGSDERELGRKPCEGPQHEVTIAKPFALGKYAVTIAEYINFCHQTGRTHPMSGYHSEHENSPITKVNYADAEAFAKWLSDQTNQEYRLPTEAEWEYATRAGTLTPFYFYEVSKRQQVNYGTTEPVAVGSLPANRWGLHELHGNVWERTQDTWHSNYIGAPLDGKAWITDRNKQVIRGGSFEEDSQGVRSASRTYTSPDSQKNYLGFRLARDL